MGCPGEICLYAATRSDAEVAFTAAEAEVHRLDRKYSHYRADSGLTEYQRRAAEPSGWPADPETAGLLEFARTQFEASSGRFDITAGHLSALWEHRSVVPSDEQVADALALTGWQKLGWDGTTLRMPAGMRFDLGGIVKEYAADRAALAMRSLGIDHGYIDLGGDFHVLGPHPDGCPWRVGIRHPRQEGQALAAIEVTHGGLATSGDYERCSIIDGVRYGHLINPMTGWPVQGLVTVSVTAPNCLLAGAMSTLAMLLDKDAGLALLETSGLSWLAHDGSFSFSGANGMLPGTPPDPFPGSNRSQPHVPGAHA